MASIKRVVEYISNKWHETTLTVHYESGRQIEYRDDTLPLTVVRFLTDENTIAETVYFDFENCINKRTIYRQA